MKRHKHSQHEGDKLVNTSIDLNKAVDDNINVDINNKTEDFEKASENVEKQAGLSRATLEISSNFPLRTHSQSILWLLRYSTFDF